LCVVETLHVVEFFIVDSIADEEAITLIGQKPWHRKESKGAKWKEVTASSILDLVPTSFRSLDLI
jgi:hypothetical protein